MQFEIEVDGRPRTVAVNRTGARFAVAVGEHSYVVDAARVDAQVLSLLVDGGVAPGPHVHDITITADNGRLVVQVGSVPVVVTLNGLRRRHREEHGASSEGPETIVAPMPGKIVRVLVRPGDLVRARQPLVVVEAMKMENELRAGRDGTVAEVHAREGMSVEAGALLVAIQ